MHIRRRVVNDLFRPELLPLLKLGLGLRQNTLAFLFEKFCTLSRVHVLQAVPGETVRSIAAIDRTAGLVPHRTTEFDLLLDDAVVSRLQKLQGKILSIVDPPVVPDKLLEQQEKREKSRREGGGGGGGGERREKVAETTKNRTQR